MPVRPRFAFSRGSIIPFAEATVPIDDRGLQFGESLYEVIPVTAGEPRLLPEHVAGASVVAGEAHDLGHDLDVAHAQLGPAHRGRVVGVLDDHRHLAADLGVLVHLHGLDVGHPVVEIQGGDPVLLAEVQVQGARVDLVCGFLGCDARPYNPLLAALPRSVTVRGIATGWLAEFPRQVVAEAWQNRAGGDTMLTRMAELMFVEVVRRYSEELSPQQTGWLAGLREPLVAAALAELHARPAHPWTLADLARPCLECGDWRDWRGHCDTCATRAWQRQTLNAEAARLAQERDDEESERHKWAERLPVARKADRPASEATFPNNPLTGDLIRYMRMVDVIRANPALEITSPTIRWVASAMGAMAEAGRDDFPGRIKVPLLMLAAARDEVVSTAAIEQLGLRLRTGRHVVIAGARHELFMETDIIRGQVFAAFDAFITEQSA